MTRRNRSRSSSESYSPQSRVAADREARLPHDPVVVCVGSFMTDWCVTTSDRIRGTVHLRYHTSECFRCQGQRGNETCWVPGRYPKEFM